MLAIPHSNPIAYIVWLPETRIPDGPLLLLPYPDAGYPPLEPSQTDQEQHGEDVDLKGLHIFGPIPVTRSDVSMVFMKIVQYVMQT